MQVVSPPVVDHAALSTVAVFVFVLSLFKCFAHLLAKYINMNNRFVENVIIRYSLMWI